MDASVERRRGRDIDSLAGWAYNLDAYLLFTLWNQHGWHKTIPKTVNASYAHSGPWGERLEADPGPPSRNQFCSMLQGVLIMKKSDTLPMMGLVGWVVGVNTSMKKSGFYK